MKKSRAAVIYHADRNIAIATRTDFAYVDEGMLVLILAHDVRTRGIAPYKILSGVGVVSGLCIDLSEASGGQCECNQ